MSIEDLSKQYKEAQKRALELRRRYEESQLYQDWVSAEQEKDLIWRQLTSLQRKVNQ